MSENRQYKSKIMILKDIPELVNEGWKPREIYQILQYQRYYNSKPVPTLNQIARTYNELRRDPNVQIAILESERNHKKDHGLPPHAQRQHPQTYGKKRLLGKLYSLSDGKSPVLHDAIVALKERQKGSRRISKYFIAEQGLNQLYSKASSGTSRFQHSKKAQAISHTGEGSD